MKKFHIIILVTIQLTYFVNTIQIKTDDAVKNDESNNFKPKNLFTTENSVKNCGSEKFKEMKLDAKTFALFTITDQSNLEIACHEKCQIARDCVAYAYNKKNTQCALYQGTNGTLMQHEGWVTVLPHVKTNNLISWLTFSDVHVKEFSKEISGVDNPYECWRQCVNDQSNCIAFTFNILNKVCHISNSNSNENFFFQSHCLSGYRISDSPILESYLGFTSRNKRIKQTVLSSKISNVIPINIESCFKSCKNNQLCEYLSIESNNNETLKCTEYDHLVNFDEDAIDLTNQYWLFEKDLDFRFDTSFEYTRTLSENYSKNTCSFDLNTKRSKRFFFSLFSAIAAIIAKVCK